MKTLRATYPRAFRAFGSGASRSAPSVRSVITPCSTAKRWPAYLSRSLGTAREIIRLIAEISMGAGTLAMIGGTVVIVGFLTLAAGGTLAVQGYSSLGNIGIEALPDSWPRSSTSASWHRSSPGSDWRPPSAPGDRAIGCHADQRRDRCAGSDGDPADLLSGQHQNRGRHAGDHPAVQHRRHIVFPGKPIHHGCVVRPVGWPCTTTTSTPS